MGDQMELACIKEKIEVAVKPGLLSQLSIQQKNCKIKARICRIWESTAPFLKGDIFSLEFLLVDEEGFSMQATIRKQDVADIRPRITEGNVYEIAKFIIIPSRKRFVAVERDYMIQIDRRTELTQTGEDIAKIPFHSFHFSIFYEVEKKRYNDIVLTDVVGRITTMGEITHKYIGQTLTPMRNLEIEDSDKNILSVTLWDQFAISFDETCVSLAGPDNPVIIILAGMTVRTFRDKVHLSTCSASKLYFNLDIPEVADLLSSLRIGDNSIQRITYGEEKIISPHEEMQLNRKSITDLIDLALTNIENEKFTCEATITDIDTSYGWWYKACHSCKTAIKMYGDTFSCSRCNSNECSPLPWYKLNTVVDDGTGVANFIIFEKLAEDLVRIPAQHLSTMVNSDQFTLPPLIKIIINQKHIFQVTAHRQKFTTSLPSFKVIKIFSLNNDPKGKTQNEGKIIPKHEGQLQLSLSPVKKIIETELSTETSPATQSSSSSKQASTKRLHTRRKRARDEEAGEECEDIK